jgi:hypothetical protein
VSVPPPSSPPSAPLPGPPEPAGPAEPAADLAGPADRAGLAGLPGSAADPGSGPASAALLDGLLDDAVLLDVPLDVPLDMRPDVPLDTRPVAAAVAQHRALRDRADGELLTGPLLVPAGLAEAVAGSVRSGEHPLRVLLVPDPPAMGGPDRDRAAPDTAGVSEQLEALRRARNLFLDDDGIELVGVQVSLPRDLPAADGARAVVDALDFTAPAWLELDPGLAGAGQALAVLAEDGAEGLALATGGPHRLPAGSLAAGLRAAVDRELTVRAVGGPLPWIRPADPWPTGSSTPGSSTAGSSTAVPHGVLNLLCAVRAALNGADVEQLTAILTTTAPGPLLSAVRRMSGADAVVARAFLAAVPVRPVAGALDEVARLGLLPTDLG